jgi:hypothetical protein
VGHPSFLHCSLLTIPASGEQKDWKTIGLMNTVLDNEHADLVVLNGDLLSCEYVAPDRYNNLLDQVALPLVSRNLRFAATFGNHDYSETCNTHDMSAHMWHDVRGTNGKKLSFTTQSVDGANREVGESNYYIPVYGSKDGSKLEMLLWFFDSKGGHVYQPGKNVNEPTGDNVHDKVPQMLLLVANCSLHRSFRGLRRLATNSTGKTIEPSQASASCTSLSKLHAPFRSPIAVRVQNLALTTTSLDIKVTVLASTATRIPTTHSRRHL